jgi:hypothetical protein
MRNGFRVPCLPLPSPSFGHLSMKFSMEHDTNGATGCDGSDIHMVDQQFSCVGWNRRPPAHFCSDITYLVTLCTSCSSARIFSTSSSLSCSILSILQQCSPFICLEFLMHYISPFTCFPCRVGTGTTQLLSTTHTGVSSVLHIC